VTSPDYKFPRVRHLRSNDVSMREQRLSLSEPVIGLSHLSVITGKLRRKQSRSFPMCDLQVIDRCTDYLAQVVASSSNHGARVRVVFVAVVPGSIGLFFHGGLPILLSIKLSE
jgi:hypothetical protein